MAAPLVVTPAPAGFARLRFVSGGPDVFTLLTAVDTMSGTATHVEAVLSDGIIGAYTSGVAKVSLEYDTKSTVQTFVDIPMTSAMTAAWEAALVARLGQPYDWHAIAGFAAHMNLHSPGHVICSALQTIALRVCEWFSGPLGVPEHMITPRDLLLVLAAQQARGVVVGMTERRAA